MLRDLIKISKNNKKYQKIIHNNPKKKKAELKEKEKIESILIIFTNKHVAL